jgi:hypothetical protein
VTVRICDRCGTVTVNEERCICVTPHSAAEVIGRHRAAAESARISGGRIHVQPSRRIDPDMSVLAASSATTAGGSHLQMVGKALSGNKEAHEEIDGAAVLESPQAVPNPRREAGVRLASNTAGSARRRTPAPGPTGDGIANPSQVG